MKKLMILAASMLASVSSFAGTFQCSTAPDADGFTTTVSIDSNTGRGTVQLSHPSAFITGPEYNVHVYIMNDNSPGFYYFEGLLREPEVIVVDPLTGKDTYSKEPRWFKMKFNREDTNARFVHMTTGASDKKYLEFAKCSISRAD